MIRFTMPSSSLCREEQIADLKSQFNDFMNSDALSDICRLLGTDAYSIAEKYNPRKASKRIMEVQYAHTYSSLESLRYDLYPLFRELGFIDINEPASRGYTRIVVLGGSLNACFLRAYAAADYLTEDVISADAISCYRPISPVERSSSSFESVFDTEFGVMSDAMVSAFGLDGVNYTDDFVSDRNLNGISCIRSFDESASGCMHSIFGAPSLEPGIRRADTFDSLNFYLKKQALTDSERLLFVTNNVYCNRQFLQLASEFISSDEILDFDIIGCSKGDKITSADTYNVPLYVSELTGIIDWIKRFTGKF